MIRFGADTFYLLQRHIRTTLRIPIWIFVLLAQPIIYLTLFGQLFSRVVDLPGFDASSYIAFIAPGIVIMTAMFGSMWSGMGLIEDLHEGVIDRMLATPIHRGALIAARVLHATLTVTVQSLIILGISLLLGARLSSGLIGIAVILLPAVLLGAGFAALSNGIAILARREETLVALVNFFGMPLTFLSTAFMAAEFMPAWMQFVARGNPVDWAVTAARYAMLGEAWKQVWTYSVLLTGFAVVASVLARQAFRVYTRTT